MPQLSPGAIAYLAVCGVIILLFFLPVFFLLPSLSIRPSLQHRAPFLLSIAQTVAALAVTLVYLLHSASPVLAPCPIMLWIPAMALPALLFCLLSRYVHLGGHYWTAANKLAQGRQRDRGSLAAEAASLNSSGQEVREDIEAGRVAVQLGEQARWRLRLINVFRLANLARVSLAIFLLQTIALVLVQVFTQRITWNAPACPSSGWEFAPVYAATGLTLLLLVPASTLAVSGVHDAYGIRLEIDIALTIMVLSFAAQSAINVLGPRVPWMAPVQALAGDGQVWVFCAVCVHLLTVYMPMIAAWRGTAADQRRQRMLAKAPPMRRSEKYGVSDQDSPDRPDFERIMLDDPKLLRAFRLFTVREFTVERVLFFERYRRARQTAEESQVADPLGPGRVWRDLYKKIYFDFLRPNAEMTLGDVSNKVLMSVRKEFRAETFGIGVLDAAAEEVWRALWVDTYPRFLVDWRKTARADMGKQQRWGRRRQGSKVGAAALGVPTPGRKLSSAVRKGSKVSTSAPPQRGSAPLAPITE